LAQANARAPATYPAKAIGMSAHFAGNQVLNEIVAEFEAADGDQRPMALIGGGAGVPGVNERPLRAHS